MKKILPIIIALLGLASCSYAPINELPGEVDFSDLDPKTSFIPYNVNVDVLDDATLYDCPLPMETEDDVETRTTSIGVLNVIKQVFSTTFRSDVRSYCGTYWSVDEENKPVKLSGRIILPANGEVKRVMVVSHFTIGRNDEAPSLTLPLECLFSIAGLAVICPDYLGYGVSCDRKHPYLCAELTARNVTDMYFAALPFLKKIGCSPKYDDIYLFGYSQGGAATLAVQNYFEYNYPSTKLRLTMAGSGPYDVAITYDVLIEKDHTDFPCAIPMIIQGLDVGMGLGFKEKNDYADFFKPELQKNYDKWINSKQYTMGQITRMMGSKRISDALTDEARDKTNEVTIELYKAMLDNSLTNRYLPTTPVYLFHSFDDNVVPFENSAVLCERLSYYGVSNVQQNFGNYGDHTMGFVRFLYTCVDLLKDNGDI